MRDLHRRKKESGLVQATFWLPAERMPILRAMAAFLAQATRSVAERMEHNKKAGDHG